MIKTDTFQAEQILLGNYIKYYNMGALTAQAFTGSDANEVNIYIDMYQMTLELYGQVRLENHNIVASSIINLCAHIRAYYRTRHGVETKIFIVYSTNMSRPTTQIMEDYNKNNRDKIIANRHIDNAIKNNVQLLKTLCPYIPDVHFISGSFEPSVIMYDIICKQSMLGNNNPNIVFSKSIMTYQLPALMLDTVVFRNKKSKGEDTSRVIMTRNVLQEYFIETRKQESTPNINGINGELLSLLMALSNVTSRNIPSLFNATTAVNLLVRALQDGQLLNMYNSDIKFVYDQLNYIKKIPVDYDTFANRFRCIDLRYQLLVYIDSAESNDDSYLLTLYDDDTVRAINNEYFKNNPLDLNRL